MKKRKSIELYFKCPDCNNFIPFESDMCEYCGTVIFYDDEKSEYYVSGKVCYKCGSENKVDSSYCENCNSRFTLVCPSCRDELEIGEEHCKQCGFRIDESFIENEVNRRLALRKKTKSKKTGLYFSCGLFLLLGLLFTFLSFQLHEWSIRKIGLILGSVIFFTLFIVFTKNLIETEKGKYYRTT